MFAFVIAWLTSYVDNFFNLNETIKGKWHLYLWNWFWLKKYRKNYPRGRLDLHDCFKTDLANVGFKPFPEEIKYANPKKHKSEDLFILGLNTSEKTTIQINFRRRPVAEHINDFNVSKDDVTISFKLRDNDGNVYSMENCSTVLTKLKRNNNAGPFLRPVDPVALNIPDYLEKISHPMDISTIKRKLDTHVYKNMNEFNSDVELMFNNCYTYNPPDTPVHLMGKDLQKYYDTLMADMPAEKRAEPSEPHPQDKGKRVQRRPSAEDRQRCDDILAELAKPIHQSFMSKFWAPAPSEKQQAQGKGSVAGLDAVRGKLESGQYNTFNEFIGDIKSIISSCLSSNSPETTIYEQGKEFEALLAKLLTEEKDVYSRIAELRQKISSMSSELRSLEASIGSKRNVFSVGDRERIGRVLLDLDRTQAVKIAEIVQRHGVYEYIDNDEIEINLHTMPDEVIGEIDEYMRKVKSSTAQEEFASSEE